jgi:hypothetical protein
MMKFMTGSPMRFQLRFLLDESRAPAVSIFLPTHRAGQEIRQDPIRLKNLVRQAEQQLINEGTRAAEARNLLEPVAGLVEDSAFWRRQAEGLAVFRSPNVFRTYQVPFPVAEFVAVSDRFYIKPLLPLLINEARFYVLALSQKAVRLLDCTRDGVEAVPLPDVPPSMTETPGYERREKQLQSEALAPKGSSGTSSGGGTALLHGHGSSSDASTADLERYFRAVDRVVCDILRDRHDPLLLAGVEHILPLYRSISHYAPIFSEHLLGNADELRDDELHRKAWPIADRHFQQARDKAVAEYHEGIVKGRAGHELSDVLTAAFQGRIATLFIPLGLRRWGRFDFNRLALEEHAHEEPGDEELLDLAAAQTLRQDGKVYGMKPEEIPRGHLLAAVYRY